MTVPQLVGILLVVGSAAMVQRVSGFGFGLIVVPLLSLFIPPRDAVIIATLLAMATTLAQAWSERAVADRPVANRLFLAACAGMPFGLIVFLVVSDSALRVTVGVVVIAAAYLLGRGFALSHGSRRDEYILGALSGVLNTSVSTNGPPLVFLLQARGYEPARFRGTISRVFAMSNVVSLTLFLAAGKVTAGPAAAALASVPVVIAAQWLGSRLVKHFNGERFRILVLVLLYASGAAAIVAAWTH